MVETYITSAFCKNGKGGNKAGVVLNQSGLNAQHKQDIAKTLGYSETAFVSDSDKADYKLEYFTPTEEVPLCGHATIAAFSTMKILHQLDKTDCTIETKAGVFHIRIQEDSLVLMEQHCPTYRSVLNWDVFTGCVETDFIDHSLPIQIVSTGLNDIMLPVDSAAHLEKLSPNFENIAAMCREKHAVGVHAFTFVGESDVTAICRNFAPLYGIDEESATGTASCALACYLFRYVKKQSQYIFEQGQNIGEISRIIVNLSYHEKHENNIDAVYVGGYGSMIGRNMISKE